MINQENNTANRGTAILVGILFLIATVAFFIADSFFLSLFDNSDYLTQFSKDESRVKFGAMLALVDGIAVVAISLLLFPLLKKKNERLAIGYVSFRVIEFSIILVYLLGPLLLITVSQEYVDAGSPSDLSFQTLGEYPSQREFGQCNLFIFAMESLVCC